MKKSLRRFIGLALAPLAVGSAVFLVSQVNSEKSQEPIYKARTEVLLTENANSKGSAQWLHKLRANQVTGEVNPADVLKARLEALQGRNNKTASALNLSWEQRGPDNIGGRTRTIFIDPENPNLIFSGSVSGGLYRSTTAGSSWELLNRDASNHAVTYITKTSNGHYYYGTGEGLHYGAFGQGSGGVLGGGVFKSTDGGNTWVQLASTAPDANDRTSEWANISFLIAHPTIADKIFAATNRGLRRSDDGGQTWVNPVLGSSVQPQEFTAGITDMIVDNNGGVWFKGQNHIMFSPDGSDGSFVQISGSSGLPTNPSRSRIAVSPSDPNFVYVAHINAISSNPTGVPVGGLLSVHRSKDRGATWERLVQGSSSFNPMNTQGEYDLALTVDPKDKNRIILGGVQLWDWSETTGWNQIHSSFFSPTNPFYVHVDQHDAVFHPTNPDILYVVNDGGIFRSSNNGFTWTPINNNYTTLQLYSVIGDQNGRFLGGTQDNGTIAITGFGNTSRSGVRTPGINYFVASGVRRVMDGDGGYVAASQIVPGVLFKEMQYGIMGRSQNDGQSFESFYQFNRMDPQYISGTMTGTFAEFVAPFELWESNDDRLSTDSVTFRVLDVQTSLGFASSSDTASRGELRLPQAAAVFIPDSFRVVHGPYTLRSDANGNLSSPDGGSGFFNAQTGQFVARFPRYFGLEVSAFCDIRYNTGSMVYVESASKGVPFDYTLPRVVSSGDSIRVQDIIQGAFFMGLRTRPGLVGNTFGGVWMTRKVFDFTTEQPEWWHILDLGNGNAATCMDVSADGDVLFVGGSDGRLWRVANLKNARSRTTADIDNQNTAVLTTRQVVANYSGRSITSVKIDPNDNDRVIVTLGNYGNNTYVFLSNNATAASPSFVPKQGSGLPAMPVYGSTFNIFDGQQVVIGTEYGVYSTDNINASSVVWNSENNGIPTVPVFMVEQLRNTRGSIDGDLVFQGHIDLATHGYGFLRSSNLVQQNPIGINEELNPKSQILNSSLHVYPNPASSSTKIAINLDSRGSVLINLIDINGREVKRAKFQSLESGKHELLLSLDGLKPGIYIIGTEYSGTKKTTKLIVR